MKGKLLTLLAIATLAVLSFSSTASARVGFLEEAIAYCGWGSYGIECIEGSEWCIEENCF